MTHPQAKALAGGEGRRWPCVHGADCDGAGLDCGPDFTRQYTKRAAPKSASEMSEIRARAWATRRAMYGERGHRGSYSR